MSAQDPVTQDMLEVLAKVQSDPQSKLFAQGIQLGPAQSTEQPLTGKEPFLSAAERKLIRAYREQVEGFLYARAFRSVRDSEWGQAKLVNSNADCAASADAECVAGAARKLSSVNQDICSVIMSTGDPVGDLKLALNLLPSSRARIVLGLAYQSVGRLAPAIEVLASVESLGSSDYNRAIAAANRALLYWDQAEYVRAAKAYGASLSSNPSDGRVAIFTLISSLASGRLDLVAGAEKILIALESGFVGQDLRSALRTSDVQGAKRLVSATALKGFRPKSQTGQQVLQFFLD
ncbi:MAG: hypothetical protein JKY61_12950 [Planctomycetes bacterium]|nr:hypothetical protein [Planctomycetota bacterium]